MGSIFLLKLPCNLVGSFKNSSYIGLDGLDFIKRQTSVIMWANKNQLQSFSLIFVERQFSEVKMMVRSGNTEGLLYFVSQNDKVEWHEIFPSRNILKIITEYLKKIFRVSGTIRNGLMSRRSSVASPIYEKCRPRNDGKTKKNVDLIQDLTKTFIPNLVF